MWLLSAWGATAAFPSETARSPWGLLFHAEADAALVETWLAEPTMTEEAEKALGPDAATELKRQAGVVEQNLTLRSAPGFQAFAKLAA